MPCGHLVRATSLSDGSEAFAGILGNALTLDVLLYERLVSFTVLTRS
jgi:hypothetical protein